MNTMSMAGGIAVVVILLATSVGLLAVAVTGTLWPLIPTTIVQFAALLILRKEDDRAERRDSPSDERRIR
jgi:uncharacterized protein YqgC (DUF456 family)